MFEDRAAAAVVVVAVVIVAARGRRVERTLHEHVGKAGCVVLGCEHVRISVCLFLVCASDRS